MEAYGNNILFRPFQIDGVSEGGIIVPDSMKTASNKGEIVSVGSGTAKKPMTLKVGMVGYRVKSWGDEVVIGGITHFIMDQSAIIALEDNGIYYNEQPKQAKSKSKSLTPVIKSVNGKIKMSTI